MKKGPSLVWEMTLLKTCAQQEKSPHVVPQIYQIDPFYRRGFYFIKEPKMIKYKKEGLLCKNTLTLTPLF